MSTQKKRIMSLNKHENWFLKHFSLCILYLVLLSSPPSPHITHFWYSFYVIAARPSDFPSMQRPWPARPTRTAPCGRTPATSAPRSASGLGPGTASGSAAPFCCTTSAQRHSKRIFVLFSVFGTYTRRKHDTSLDFAACLRHRSLRHFFVNFFVKICLLRHLLRHLLCQNFALPQKRRKI